MAVSRVKNEDVYLSFNESGNSFKNIVSHADSSTAKKSALFISCGIWILNSLFNILDSDKTLKNAVCINKRKLLDLMLHKYLLSAFKIRINRSSNEVFLSHNVTDLDIFKISDKSKISVSEDTLKLAILIDYRHAGDLILAHELISFSNSFIGCKRERINDNAVFRTLYLIHLFCLLSDSHILMNNTDTALSCDSDSHF